MAQIANAKETEQRSSLRTRATSATLFSIALLSPIGDLPLTSSFGGALGARPSLLLVPLAFMLINKKSRSKTVATLWATLMIGTIVTLISIPFLPYSAASQPVWSKALRVALTVACWIALVSIARKSLGSHRRALLAGTAVAFVASVLYLYAWELPHGNPATTDILHATINYQQRPRILSPESSSAGASVVALGAGIVLLSRGRLLIAFVTLPVTVLAALAVHSRGTYVALIASAALGGLLFAYSRTKVNAKWDALPALAFAAVLVVAFLASAVGAVSVASRSTNGNADTSVSDATRAAWSNVGLVTLTEYPLGLGFGAPIVELPRLLQQAQSTLYAEYPTTAWNELGDVIASQSDDSLAPKTLPSTLSVYFGAIGILIWIGLVTSVAIGAIRGARKHYSGWIFCLAASFALVATTTYVPGIYDVAVTLLIGYSLAADSKGLSGD